MNEDELCKKRLIDLSRQAFNKGIIIYSDFLNLNELNIYHQSKKDFYCRSESFGGIPYAERQMAAFIPDALSYAYEADSDYPITLLKITPSHPKFAEKLGHRDILGSIMNLGVDRSKLGDIIVSDDGYYILCEDAVSEYFIDNLMTIRHTAVALSRTKPDNIAISSEFKSCDGIVSSNRIDAVIACVYRLSRKEALSLVTSEKVYVNGRVCPNPSYGIKPDDIISVRGMGRFIYDSEYGVTGKGRLKISYKLYSR